jgi:very-short-patch-repair endonuclease
MKARITDFLAHQGRGIITTEEARRLGCSPEALRTLVREGTITRVARGVYVRTALLDPDPAEVARLGRAALTERQHLLRLDAVLRSYRASVAASHQSAVLAWGLPALWTTLDRVHVVHTARGRTARRHQSFTIHTCELDDVITRHQGRAVVVPALAVIGTAVTAGLVAGVVATDGALRARRTTKAELVAQLDRMAHTPGLTTARTAVALADGLAESPGETRLRILLVRLGIRFLAQHWIRTASGRRYRVDFYLPDLGVVLEFDGRLKYDGPDAADGYVTLVAEKHREDDLRLDGFGVGRVTWAALTADQVARTVATARAQAQPRAVRRPADTPAHPGG